jgi:GNAT superfamily N-acetyltransferase
VKVCEDGPNVLVSSRKPDDLKAFCRAAVEAFKRDAFKPSPEFEVLLAESGGAIVGYALFHLSYEPSYSARGVYLSDLYVTPDRRPEGVGRALLARVAREAAARGRTFVWWVSRTNEARGFYRTLANVEQPVTAHAVTFAAFQRLLG